MVGLCPLSLTLMAADAFFSTFHCSQIAANLMRFADDNIDIILGKLPLTYIECDLEDTMMMNLDGLKSDLDKQQEYLNNVEDLKMIKELHWKRARLFSGITGEIILGFMMGDNLLVDYGSRHVLSAMMFLGLKNYGIIYLKSLDQLNYSLFDISVKLCPYLEYVHLRVKTLDYNVLCSLLAIEDTVKSVTIFCTELDATVNDLSQIFFGDAISTMRKNYIDCEELIPTFKKLEYLQLPIDNVKYFDFLKFFLHYYPNTKWTSLKMKPTKPDDLSVFDGVLCYTIDMNPLQALHVCDLVYEDLRFPYLEDCLSKWVNLKSLSITLRSFTMPLEHKKLSKTLSSILKRNKNITRLTVSVESENCTKFFHYIQDAVENCCDNISDLRLKVCKLRISDIINFVNCFPSISSLFLDVTLQMGKAKGELKFKHLTNLRSLHLDLQLLNVAENISLATSLVYSTTKLKYFGLSCYGGLFYRLPRNILPPNLEMLNLQIVFPMHITFSFLLTFLYESNLKQFRLDLLSDTGDFAKAGYKLILSKLRNSSIDYGLLIKDSLDINHSRFEIDI